MYQLRQFPLSESEFESLFSDESACIGYLFNTRWPNGFTCPVCHENDLAIVPSRLITCIHCGGQTSLIKGTIMEGSDMPLHDWLLALWWLSKSDGGTMEIPGRLQLGRDKVAGGWLQRLRVVMAFAADNPCSGVVEIGSRLIVTDDKTFGPVLVMAAGERIFLSGAIGRIHIEVIDALNAATVRAFVNKSLEAGCTIVGPKLSAYQEAAYYGDVYVMDSGLDCPVGIHGMLSRFAAWLEENHHGDGKQLYLQQYCDEYCFQHNTTIQADDQSTFSSPLEGCFAGFAESYMKPVST